MRKILTAAAAAIAILGAGAASAVTVESTNFIATPTYFNGFEGIASNPNFVSPFFFPSNTAYAEGGITVEYVGTAQMWLQYQYVGNFGWYENGGGFGYTKVTLTSGADFGALQFLSSTGFSGSSTTYYQALNNGTVVSTGTLGPVSSNGLRYQGLSGGGFDEVRLQSHFSGAFNAAIYEAGAYDSFAATGAVPEPASWALMIVGFGMVGFASRRRSAVVAA
jgi:hypothetical protein